MGTSAAWSRTEAMLPRSSSVSDAGPKLPAGYALQYTCPPSAVELLKVVLSTNTSPQASCFATRAREASTGGDMRPRSYSPTLSTRSPQ